MEVLEDRVKASEEDHGEVAAKEGDREESTLTVALFFLLVVAYWGMVFGFAVWVASHF